MADNSTQKSESSKPWANEEDDYTPLPEEEIFTESTLTEEETDKTDKNNIYNTYTPEKKTDKTDNLFNDSKLEKEEGKDSDSLIKETDKTDKPTDKTDKKEVISNISNISLSVDREGGREKFYKLFEARIRKDLGIQRRASIYLIEALIKTPSMTRDEITKCLTSKGASENTAYQIPTDLKKAKILIEDNGSYTLNPDTVNDLLKEYTQDVSPEITDKSNEDSFKEWLKTVLNNSGELEVDLLDMPEDFKVMALNEPDKFLGKLAIDDPRPTQGEIKAKFFNMPEPRKLLSHTIKAEYMLKLIEVKGTTFAMTERKAMVVEAVFKCDLCGEFINKKKENMMEEPKKPIICDNLACGRNGPFTLMETHSTFTDVRIATLRSDGDQSAKGLIVVFREEDALSIERGMRIKVQGILRRRKIHTKKGETSYYYLEAINFEELHNKDQIYNEKEVQEYLKGLGKPFLDHFKAMAFPRIAGMDSVKEAILLSLVSPHWKDRGHGREGFERDNLNLLLVSDFGQAKGMFQRYIKDLENVEEISGGHCTKPGLISATINDPDTGFYLTIPGALPKSDGKHVIINEFQNFSSELMPNLREAFEDGITHVNKANTSEVIISRITCIAFANYTKGFIDTNYLDNPRSQIKWMDEGFVSRFDFLLFAYDDLTPGLTQEIIKAKRKSETPIEDIKKIRKAIAYMRGINPIIPQELDGPTQESVDYLIKKFPKEGNGKLVRGRTVRTVQCTAKAYARIDNRHEVEEGDILKARDFIDFSSECKTALKMSFADDQKKAQQELMKDVLKVIEDSTTPNGGITLEDLKANFKEESKPRIKRILKELEDKQKIEMPLKGQYRFLEAI